jgi:hypothetical protein
MSTGRNAFGGDSSSARGSMGSRGLDGLRSPANRSGSFGDTSRSGLDGRESIARQIARPSSSDRLGRSAFADGSGDRNGSIGRDSALRGSMGSSPINRDATGGSFAGRSGGLRGSDSVARQIARPGGFDRTVTRGSDSSVLRSGDRVASGVSRSGNGLTRSSDIADRTRLSDASGLTRRTATDVRQADRIGRDGPIGRALDGAGRTTVRNSPGALADSVSLRRGADLGRTMTRSPGVREAANSAVRSVSPSRMATSVDRGGVARGSALNRMGFAGNAGSQMARSAVRSNDVFVATRHGWANFDGHGLSHGSWGHGDWGHGGWDHHGWGHGDWDHHGWHGAEFYGWYGHHGGYFHDYHWYYPHWWGASFSFGYYHGPYYMDCGFRYAYPYYGACWPPAVVYYDYSYPYAYYPPLVYSSVCYTPFYAPVYYSAPVVPVFPSYYYPGYSVMYYYPSLYYTPPVTSFGISTAWSAQNNTDGDSAPAYAGAPVPSVKDLPAPETAENASAASGDGNLDLGLKALRAGQLEQARVHLTEAIHADPSDGIARMLYTATLVADGQYKDASLALRDTFQVWGNVQLKDFYLPSVYTDPQAQARYLRDLRAFLSDHPDRLDGWLLTIWSCAFSGRTDQAAGLLTEARKTWPDDPGLAKLESLMRVG